MTRPALLDITHAFTKNSGLCICCEVFVVRGTSSREGSSLPTHLVLFYVSQVGTGSDRKVASQFKQESFSLIHRGRTSKGRDPEFK